MKRLTYVKQKSRWNYGKNPTQYSSRETFQFVCDRLGKIEDILGDEYDLDRLRELKKADDEGQCVVLPCKIGDTVYSIRHERVPDDDYRMSFHTEMRIVSQKFGLIHADCIGKSVFLTREAAEAALRREQDDE